MSSSPTGWKTTWPVPAQGCCSSHRAHLFGFSSALALAASIAVAAGADSSSFEQPSGCGDGADAAGALAGVVVGALALSALAEPCCSLDEFPALRSLADSRVVLHGPVSSFVWCRC